MCLLVQPSEPNVIRFTHNEKLNSIKDTSTCMKEIKMMDQDQDQDGSTTVQVTSKSEAGECKLLATIKM